MTTLQELLQSARQATGVRFHGDPHAPRVERMPAAAVATISLRDLASAPLSDEGGQYRALIPTGTTPAKSATLETEIARQSLVCKAGARLIVWEPIGEVHAAGNLVAFVSRPSSFGVIEPAHFDVLPDGVNVAPQAYPSQHAEIDFDSAPQVAARFTVSRPSQKQKGDAMIEAELMHSLVRGLALAVDKRLLAAIEATTPAAFSLGAAAAKNLTFGELRAITGNGTGASVAADSKLRISGVPAELSGQLSGTVIGAFSRAAVCLHSDVRLVVNKLGTNGEMDVTAFACMQPLVPDASYWWAGA